MLCYVVLISEPTTATVGRVVIPRANQISAENWVYPGAADKGPPIHHTTYTVVPGQDGEDGTSSSSESSSSTEPDMEQYDREPGIRQPSRSFSGDLDAEDYNEEPVPLKKQPASSEDQPKPDSKFPVQKAPGKKVPENKVAGKKGPQLKVPAETRGRSFADHVHDSPGLSEDVWKEAMAGVPLASSESFDMHLLSRDKEQSASLEDIGDDDAFERRARRRKGKPDRSGNQVFVVVYDAFKCWITLSFIIIMKFA